MSDDLYRTRCWYDGRQGIARCDGVTIELILPPTSALGNQGVREIAYTPALRDCRVRESAHPWRDMTPAEITHIEAWLHRMAAKAREALNT